MSNPVELLYRGKCSVYEYKNVTDPITKITKQEEQKIYDNQPCLLSFGSSPSTKGSDAPVLSQTIKLFVSPSINIKPGSKIIITQDNVTTEYSRSGKSATYPTHQEIPLELFGGYA